mgnify:CR=1 FL=1
MSLLSPALGALLFGATLLPLLDCPARRLRNHPRRNDHSDQTHREQDVVARTAGW